jgi:hypothetical protein
MLETKGVLIGCKDEAIYMYLRRLDETQRKFILRDVKLDGLHMMVDPGSVQWIQDKIDELMDAISYDRMEK